MLGSKASSMPVLTPLPELSTAHSGQPLLPHPHCGLLLRFSPPKRLQRPRKQKLFCPISLAWLLYPHAVMCCPNLWWPFVSGEFKIISLPWILHIITTMKFPSSYAILVVCFVLFFPQNKKPTDMLKAVNMDWARFSLSTDAFHSSAVLFSRGQQSSPSLPGFCCSAGLWGLCSSPLGLT